MDCRTLGFPVLHCLTEFAQTHVHWVSDAIQPSHPLSPTSPLALFFPSIRIFFNELALHIRWPKYWSFSFSISPSNQYSGLISLRLTGLISLQSKGLSRVFSRFFSHVSHDRVLSKAPWAFNFREWRLAFWWGAWESQLLYSILLAGEVDTARPAQGLCSIFRGEWSILLDPDLPWSSAGFQQLVTFDLPDLPTSNASWPF